MKTKVYSRLPHTLENPEEAYELTQRERSLELQPLPWPMEELVWSEWRYPLYPALIHIHKIGVNHEGLPTLYYVRESLPGTFEDKQLGVWFEGRYRIQGVVRVDHLSPRGRLNWWLWEIKRRREQLGAYGRHQYRLSHYEHEQKKIALAIAQAQQLAAYHDLQLPLDLLNAGIQPGQQMALL
jgi:hypothetical protein